MRRRLQQFRAPPASTSAMTAHSADRPSGGTVRPNGRLITGLFVAVRVQALRHDYPGLTSGRSRVVLGTTYLIRIVSLVRHTIHANTKERR